MRMRAHTHTQVQLLKNSREYQLIYCVRKLRSGFPGQGGGWQRRGRRKDDQGAQGSFWTWQICSSYWLGKSLHSCIHPKLINCTLEICERLFYIIYISAKILKTHLSVQYRVHFSYRGLVQFQYFYISNHNPSTYLFIINMMIRGLVSSWEQTVQWVLFREWLPMVSLI